MRPVVSQRYLILQNLDHPLQHASFAAGWNAVVSHDEIGECVLQASPLPQRPLNEVFHRSGHRTVCVCARPGGWSRLFITDVEKGLLAKTTACPSSFALNQERLRPLT